MNRRKFLKHGFAGLIALAMPAGLGITSIVDEGQSFLPDELVGLTADEYPDTIDPYLGELAFQQSVDHWERRNYDALKALGWR